MTEKKNIDKKEIEKFDDLAESWWDPEGDFKIVGALKGGMPKGDFRNRLETILQST